MKLLIDGRMWSNTGVGVYIRNLASWLDKNETELEKVILVLEKDRDQIRLDRFKIITTDINIYTLAEQLRLPKLIETERPDLVHFPHFNVPYLYNHPFVLTFHDLTTLRFVDPGKSLFAKFKTVIKKRLQIPVMRHAVTRASKIFTATNFVKSSLESIFTKAEGKTYTTYMGLGMRFETPSELVGVSKPFALYVGNLFQHKNLEILVRSWQRVIEAVPGIKLVVGGAGREQAKLEQIVRENKLPVQILGRVSTEQLGALYNHASAFVFPSLSEGFGLPPLEAMTNGVPVVSSNATCMPEVLGDAALYFDPRSEDEMVAQITRILTDQALRAEMIRRGYEQVKKYSWEKMARETLAVYREVLGLLEKNSNSKS